MSRKARMFRIDDRVLSAIDELAREENRNTNQFVEWILLNFAKDAGKLPTNTIPLKDGRGGNRKAASNSVPESPLSICPPETSRPE